MVLEEGIKKVNNQIKKSMANIKLEELIGTDEYSNYTLFDLINYFKIRRMSELDVITSVQEKEMFTYYRKYNTKVAEKKKYKDFPNIIMNIDNELEKTKEILIAYGIQPDKSKPLIKIEDMVRLDILNRTASEIKNEKTSILKQETIERINASFSEKVLNFVVEDISFMRIYNLLKIELLAEMNYTNKNNTSLVYALYNRFLETKDSKIYKELSKDPYNLIFGRISFNFVNYIDYTIKNYSNKKEDSNYLKKIIK